MTPLTRRFVSGVAVALAIAAGLVSAQSQAPPAAADVASADMGGRIESVTSEVKGYVEWAPINLIAKSPYPGWSAGSPDLPQEIVFSFLTRQSVLIGAVVINPRVDTEGKVAAKDVEIWTSTQSPTEGFVRAAASSLKDENADQTITLTPVEVKFVKLRVVSTYARLVNGEPEPAPASLRRVRILEAQRAGYASLLSRNSELAALARGTVPKAPPDAVATLPATGLNACSTTPAATRAPANSESRHVLVIAPDVDSYTPTRLTPTTEAGSPAKPVDYSIYGRVTFTHVTPRTASPAHLLSTSQVDTVAISQVCDVGDTLSAPFKQALLAWVAAGHKLIIHDADACGGTSDLTSPNRPPDYAWLPFKMKTVNPGKAGLRGEAMLLENNTLASSLATDPSYLPLSAWVNDEEGNGNELGDSNVIVEHDPHWCGQIYGKNGLGKSGFIEAYARLGRGLIIYNGIDLEQIGSPAYNQLVTRELAQPFSPDNLLCSQPVGAFVLTTDASSKAQPAKAGTSYSYPLQVLPNFGYSGRVALAAAYVPADPSVTVTLDATTVNVGADAAHTSLVVTTTGAAPPKPGIVEVRGRDAATGRSNVLCLALNERKTGSIGVVSHVRVEGKVPKNIEIILDASGSMRAMLGTRTRWATAQDVLKDVVSKLPDDFSVGLRAYGHTRPSTDPATCTDTALVVPVEKLNPANLIAAAGRLAPRGETPLVHSILQTPEDLKDAGGGTVVLITDGEESCKGDFAAAAKTLKETGLALTLNIVGFTLQNAPAAAQLKRLAESTGGRYYGASSGEALAQAVLASSFDHVPYRILDAAGKEVAKGEAGVDSPHELTPGSYTVVVTAGNQDVRTPVVLALNQDVALKASIKGNTLVLEK